MPADEATELTLYNGRLERVHAALGGFTYPLAPGPYKLRAQAGSAVKESLFRVVQREGVVDQRVEPVIFSSPVPLNNTTATLDLQDAAADACKRSPAATPTSGAIFVFIHDKPPERATGDKLGAGLAIYSATGERNGEPERLIAALDAVDEIALGGSMRAIAFGLEVRPGLYTLWQKLPGGPVLRQTIVASPGRQTQVFMRAGPAVAGDFRRRVANLTDAAILSVKEGGFRPDAPEARLTELARLGLADRRHVLSDAALGDILGNRFADPMLGLFGAHAILSQKPDGKVKLNSLLTRLQELLGDGHPDVAALAVALKEQSAPFHHPPMLCASWRVLLAADREAEGTVIPANGLAFQVSARLWASEPWLVWRESDESATSQPGDVDVYDLSLSSSLRHHIAFDARASSDSTTSEHVSRETTAAELYAPLVESIGLPYGQVPKRLSRIFPSGHTLTHQETSWQVPVEQLRPFAVAICQALTYEEFRSLYGKTVGEPVPPTASGAMHAEVWDAFAAIDRKSLWREFLRQVAVARPALRFAEPYRELRTELGRAVPVPAPAAESASPLDAVYFRNRVFLNRAELRKLLHEMTIGSKRVAVVTGGLRTGVSYSKQLLFHLRTCHPERHIVYPFDCGEPTSLGDPEAIARVIAGKGSAGVSWEGFPERTESRKIGAILHWLAGQIVGPSGPLRWVVFDGCERLGNGSNAEVPLFIEHLSVRLAGDLDRLRLVLLGYDRPLPVDADPFLGRESTLRGCPTGEALRSDLTDFFERLARAYALRDFSAGELKQWVDRTVAETERYNGTEQYGYLNALLTAATRSLIESRDGRG